jgi:leader peptidase (prepilin peptidase)/N-methyltransferase
MDSQFSMVPGWSWVIALIFGAAIGSFLNVVVYRLPRGLSLSNPPKSFCPICKHSLGVADLFPLFSYLLAGGKCRYCHTPFSSRYFWVELLNGSLWAVIWHQFMFVQYDPLRAGFYCLTTAVLVAVFFIDWELYIIPDELNGFLLLFGLAYQFFNKTPMVGVTGALIGWGMLTGIALFGRVLFGKDAMGHGDIKMMRGVGALLGGPMLCANMIIAVVAGLVFGVAMLVIASRQAKSEPAAAVPVAESSAEIGDSTEATSQVAAPQAAEEDLPPETIGSLLIHGAWYLFCLDIVGIFAPGIYKWIGENPSEELIEDDGWKPSLTTIPFGPYLAVGAVVCMLFATPIEKGLSNYWKTVTHATSMRNSGSRGFVENRLNRLNCPAGYSYGSARNDSEIDTDVRLCYAKGGNLWNETI